MKINIQKENDMTIVGIEGRLDTTTAGELEREVVPLLQDETDIVFDCEKLDYVSSSGLRIILQVHKKVSINGHRFILRHVQASIMSVFKMTGFTSLLNIEA